MYPPDLLKRIEEAREKGLTDCCYTDDDGNDVVLHLNKIPAWVDKWDYGG